MSEPTPVIVPRETVNDESVKLLAVHVKDGDWVEVDQALFDVETSKAVLEISAPSAGFVRVMAKIGSEVAIGLPICFLGESAGFEIPGAKSDRSSQVAVATSERPTQANASRNSSSATLTISREGLVAVRFTPLAKKMAEEAGLTLESFRGVRIVRSEDVTALLTGESPPSRTSTPSPASAAVSQAPRLASEAIPSPGVELDWEELPRRKKVEIKQISGGMSHVLLSSVTVCIPTKGLRAAVECASLEGVTASSVILYEVARLLRKYPMFNSVYSDGRAGIYRSVNIGWAVDDGGGLMVPVVKEADTKGLGQIVVETQDLLERYLDRRLAVEDFLGATFTISDLSSQGVFSFSPLVSQGQAAILGIGAEYFPPDSKTGIFNITLAFDHQLADGRMASCFLQDLASRLGSYEKSLSEGRDEPETTLCCSICNRDAEALNRLKEFLVKSEVPAGYVCSVCLVGH